MDQLSLPFDSYTVNERTISVLYTDEAGLRRWRDVLPKQIAFGRGAWWLEAIADDQFVRLRLTSIEGVRKVPS
ncbi:MAG TPA: hypothetical protein P5144_14725 [Thermoanaerobaculia bacterium]|nr:hypothetical protein [Thermoanaerobaculia bacterium]